MVLIYVHVSWLEIIGVEVAELLALTKQTSKDHVGILATSAEIKFPYVEAKLLLKEKQGRERFMNSSIPTTLVSAIFDVPQTEAKKLGFQV